MYAEGFRKHEMAERGYIMDDRLFTLKIGEGHELLLALQKAGLTAAQARRFIDDPAYAKRWVDQLLKQEIDQFSKYAKLLYPISRQAEYLRSLNNQMPKGMSVPDIWFTQLDTNSDHVQCVQDLEFFFVVPAGSIKKVIEYQIKLVELTQPRVWISPDFISEVDGAYLDDTADKSMFAKPNIYRCRINLVSYWDPKNYSSVDKARQHASANGIFLAGLAAIGAYAAQDPVLYQSQDGENLPFFEIADIRSGDGGSRVFYSFWTRYDREVCFQSDGSGYANRENARPLVLFV